MDSFLTPKKASKWLVMCLFTLLETSIEFAVNVAACTVRKFNRSIWLNYTVGLLLLLFTVQSLVKDVALAGLHCNEWSTAWWFKVSDVLPLTLPPSLASSIIVWPRLWTAWSTPETTSNPIDF